MLMYSLFDSPTRRSTSGASISSVILTSYRGIASTSLICEVKAGRCDINQKSWRDPGRGNVEYAIRWMGFESDNARIRKVAETVYKRGACDVPDDRIRVRFVCFGAEPNPELKSELPEIHEVLHKRVYWLLEGPILRGILPDNPRELG